MKHLLEQRKSVILANLKRNWFFPFSAMAFFCLNITITFEYIIGTLLAVLASLVISSQIPSILKYIRELNIGFIVISLLAAIGICWSSQSAFYTYWSNSSKVQALQAIFPSSIDFLMLSWVIGAIIAVFYVSFWISVFWKEIIRIVSKNGIFVGIKTIEWVVYAVLIILALAIVIVSFIKTEAFYGTNHHFDLIYTSDSPALVKGNVYLTLTHAENDLRQPLFAVFASPFMGLPYFFGKLFNMSTTTCAILANSVQVVIMFWANFMLTRMMQLNSVKRICFLSLTSCTYTLLLFVLIMEQYIIAYFWLIFCLYLISENRRLERIVLWGAGGTLITSICLLPFLSKKSPMKSFKEWFTDILKYGLEFGALLLVFCRVDVILNLTSDLTSFKEYTGRDLALIEKLYQYSEFVHNCIIAPNAGINLSAYDHISWQLREVSNINIVGVIFFVLSIVSAFLNRDRFSSRLAAGWVGFSVVILLCLGWGTKENGLILYSLYFGWAVLVLLFQLIEKIESKLNTKLILPIFCGCSAIFLSLINIPAIIELIDFAITYFPT